MAIHRFSVREKKEKVVLVTVGCPLDVYIEENMKDLKEKHGIDFSMHRRNFSGENLVYSVPDWKVERAKKIAIKKAMDELPFYDLAKLAAETKVATPPPSNDPAYFLEPIDRAVDSLLMVRIGSPLDEYMRNNASTIIENVGTTINERNYGPWVPPLNDSLRRYGFYSMLEWKVKSVLRLLYGRLAKPVTKESRQRFFERFMSESIATAASPGSAPPSRT